MPRNCSWLSQLNTSKLQAIAEPPGSWPLCSRAGQAPPAPFSLSDCLLCISLALEALVSLGAGKDSQAEMQDAHQFAFALLFPFSFPFPAAVRWRAEHRNSPEIALKDEATARKEEAEILHQEVTSLQSKLENVEKERRDVLVRVADARKGHFFAVLGPSLALSKEHLFPV